MENVVLLTLPELTSARAVLRRLDGLNRDDVVELAAAAVVERSEDGSIVLHELDEDPRLAGTGTGGVIGAILGVLTGPLGLLVGAGTGAIIGSLADAADADDSLRIIATLAAGVPAGGCAVVAVVTEGAPDAIDRAAREVGGIVLRWDRRQLELQIATAEEKLLAARRAGSDGR